MAKKKGKPEIIITPSGHEADKDLIKVPVKVSPSMQALLANQMELIEMSEGKIARNLVFIEQHKLEMLQVEEEIAVAFSGYMRKKELAREKRLMKKAAADETNQEPAITAEQPEDIVDFEPRNDFSTDTRQEHGENSKPTKDDYNLTDIPFDMLSNDMEAASSSPAGLPSSRYEARKAAIEPQTEETDVRRIALGASIKALQTFLGRELSEKEMQSLEAQVDSYLGE